MPKRALEEPPEEAEHLDLAVLDLDQPRVCSTLLSSHNLHMCLSCGRLFCGRADGSCSHRHHLETDHRLFLHMDSGATYTLPENETVAPTRVLERIRRALAPQFTPDEVAALAGGAVGVVASPPEPHLTAVVQLLVHTGPIRDRLLLDSCTALPTRELAHVARRVWSPDWWRPTVLAQGVVLAARKAWRTPPVSPPAFFVWLTNTLAKRGCPVARSTFGGEFVVETEGAGESRVPFMLVKAQVPEVLLLKRSEVAQCDLGQLLERYNGQWWQKDVGVRVRYRVETQPERLAIQVERSQGNERVVRVPQELVFGSGRYRLTGSVVRTAKGWGYETEVGGKWCLMEGARVEETDRELLFLRESCLQVWTRVSQAAE